MSVLIRGMEMPESCDNCGLCGCYVREDGTEENYRCAVTMYPIRDFDKRHKHCPLIEIPPHGRLIDAAALKSVIQAHADLFENVGQHDLAAIAQRDGLLCAIADVANAPTIIDAETFNNLAKPCKAEEGG